MTLLSFKSHLKLQQKANIWSWHWTPPKSVNVCLYKFVDSHWQIVIMRHCASKQSYVFVPSTINVLFFLRLLSLWRKLFSSYIEFKVWSLSTTALIWTTASNFYHARDSVKSLSFSPKFNNIVNRENYIHAFVLTKNLQNK